MRSEGHRDLLPPLGHLPHGRRREHRGGSRGPDERPQRAAPRNVPEAFAGELFQPGRRAAATDGHDGAGLGLPLARRLARAVGGEVSYDPGHAPGARFTVTLPAG